MKKALWTLSVKLKSRNSDSAHPFADPILGSTHVFRGGLSQSHEIGQMRLLLVLRRSSIADNPEISSAEKFTICIQ